MLTLILPLRPIGPWQRSQVEVTAYRFGRLNFGQGPEKVLSYPKRLTNRSNFKLKFNGLENTGEAAAYLRGCHFERFLLHASQASRDSAEKFI